MQYKALLINLLGWGTQTYAQLASKHGCLVRTIQRKIDVYHVSTIEPEVRRVIVLFDTTYWGRNFDVMLFKGAISGQNLLKYYVNYETNALYKQGINSLKTKGFDIQAIDCDGRKGLIQSFKGIPVQICQFHQAAFLRWYFTKKLKLPEACHLLEGADLMKQTDKESFTGSLE